MDDLIGLLFIIAIVAGIIYVLVVYVLPVLVVIGVAIAAAIGGWGFISGVAVASKNFKEVFKEAHDKLP